MIECANCETAQFLQITSSHITFQEGELTEITEHYECTLCNSWGSSRIGESGDLDSVVGFVQESDLGTGVQ